MSYLKLVCSIIPRHIFASASEHGVTWYKYFDCILRFLSSILSLHNWVQRQEKNIPVIVYHSCLDCLVYSCLLSKNISKVYITLYFTPLSHTSRHVSRFKNCISATVVHRMVHGMYNVF